METTLCCPKCNTSIDFTNLYEHVIKELEEILNNFIKNKKSKK